MTSPAEQTRRWSRLAVGALACVPIGLLPLGCGEEEEPPPPPAPEPEPAPPPEPDPIDVEQMLRRIDADPRVEFPRAQAPYDPSLGEAVVTFAEAFLAGDDISVEAMLDEDARSTLDTLIGTGGWFEATEKIEAMRVVYLEQFPPQAENADEATIVYAVQEPGAAYLLGWDARADGGWVFSAHPTGDGERPTASAWDGLTLAGYENATGEVGGDSATPGAVEIAAGVDLQDPATLYFLIEVTRQIANQLGMDAEAEMIIDMAAQRAGIDSSATLETYTEGRLANREDDERLDPEDAGRLIEQARAMAQGFGLTVTEDQIITAIAETYQFDEDEARQYYEQATGG